MKKTKEQLGKEIFERDLTRYLTVFGYKGFRLELEEGIYSLFLGNFFIYFDDFQFVEPDFLIFKREKNSICYLCKNKEVDTNTKNPQHIRADYDKKNLEEYKTKIRQLFKVDKKIKITEIAKELKITRQAIYKNLELKKFIENLKKCSPE